MASVLQEKTISETRHLWYVDSENSNTTCGLTLVVSDFKWDVSLQGRKADTVAGSSLASAFLYKIKHFSKLLFCLGGLEGVRSRMMKMRKTREQRPSDSFCCKDEAPHGRAKGSRCRLHQLVPECQSKTSLHMKILQVLKAQIKKQILMNESDTNILFWFLEAWKIPGVSPFTVSVEYLRKDQRCQDKVEDENGVRSSDDGVENESEKDDVDESKEKEDAIEKMNKTEHVSEETQENDKNEKSKTEATQKTDGKYNEKSESEDNHNEDDHVKEVDNVNENENKSDGNDQSVRGENRKGDDASSEVVDDSQKSAKPIQRRRCRRKEPVRRGSRVVVKGVSRVHVMET
uniref:Dentin sialophosphoprotein-like isoform X1 n=1 Tax=Tanacetum cinerariifolium TaxID=118510 RepID=A0A699H5V6_TANCI|nr:dentin sialophosphoprotein-like isoform X1 [Tanacetum cinerariifolium]